MRSVRQVSSVFLAMGLAVLPKPFAQSPSTRVLKHADRATPGLIYAAEGNRLISIDLSTKETTARAEIPSLWRVFAQRAGRVIVTNGMDDPARWIEGVDGLAPVQGLSRCIRVQDVWRAGNDWLCFGARIPEGPFEHFAPHGELLGTRGFLAGSRDGGETWSILDEAPDLAARGIHWAPDGHLLLLYSSGRLRSAIWPPRGGEATTFTTICEGGATENPPTLPKAGSTQLVGIERGDGDVISVLGCGEGRYFYRSEDGGKSWSFHRRGQNLLVDHVLHPGRGPGVRLIAGQRFVPSAVPGAAGVRIPGGVRWARVDGCGMVLVHSNDGGLWELSANRELRRLID